MQKLTIHVFVYKMFFFKCLKDRSYPFVLAIKIMVELQIKVINIFASSIVISLTLILPIIASTYNIYKSETCPHSYNFICLYLYSNPKNNIYPLCTCWLLYSESIYEATSFLQLKIFLFSALHYFWIFGVNKLKRK